MKKLIKGFIIIFFFLITLSVSINVSADMGPKPYVKITINGDTKGMYMTLICKDYSARWGTVEEYDITEYIDEELKDAHLKFAEYKDEDGYKYIQYLESIEDKSFVWSYLAPSEFKILIYDSINDKFITDNKVYERYGLGTTYELVLNDENFIVTKNASNVLDIIGFFIRLCICILIELAVAIVFGFKDKGEFKFIVIINVITQVVLNITLTLMTIFIGYKTAIIYPTYLGLEIGITIFEALMYLLFIKKIEKKNEIEIKTNGKIISYAVLANVASFVLGFIITGILQFFNLFI